jgi:hypothetical protein
MSLWTFVQGYPSAGVPKGFEKEPPIYGALKQPLKVPG